MVKDLISSLTGTMSQSNVTMPTADVTISMDPMAASNGADEVEPSDVTEKPTVLSAVASQLSQETLAAR